MRPRVRSYGDSSTFTLSPVRMRMKFMRILPETWASTRCPLSSSTRNIAFGNGSTTVPSTSIASSLAIRASRRPACQHVGAVLRHRDGVLEVRREAPVAGDGRPAVVQDPHLVGPHGHHGFDGEHHPGSELWPAAGVAEVRHLRLLVERPADPVADEGADDREAVRFHVPLDRVRNVGEPPPGRALRDRQLEAFARDVEELPNARRYIAD